MPELPDITLYLEAIESRFLGKVLEHVRIRSPFVLRTHDPKLSSVEGKVLRGLRRVGKRIVFAFDEELFLVIHLMIAGRLRLKKAGAPVPGKVGLAAFDFAEGTLILTEASMKKRASIHVLRGEAALNELDPGGIEPLTVTLPEFAARLRSENHTLKRSLTDPHLFAGIGNAYSDEILHRAKLSPVLLTSRMSDSDAERLYAAVHEVIDEWTQRLRDEAQGRFPDKVTAFHDEMAVHGKFGKPCPVCGAPVQRIVRAENEANYCSNCQTGGKLLADRSLSRLLHDDWPATLEELEEMKRARSAPAVEVPRDPSPPEKASVSHAATGVTARPKPGKSASAPPGDTRGKKQ
jgi:formamidopyrimidine-DNA glycosylase